MLNGTLALHDIRDVEAFCRKLIPATWPLEHHDKEDLLAYLIETTWELSTRYLPGNGHPPRFSVYAHPIVQRRTYDWLRQRNGRTIWKFKDKTYERSPITFTELTDDERGHFRTSDVDPQEHRDPDRQRLDTNGDIPAVAYFPPGSLWATRRVRDHADQPADRQDDYIKAA